MKRLLLFFAALWLPLAVMAQTTITVHVTYTTGAAAAAAAQGTTVAAKVTAAFNDINTAYAASGITIVLVPSTSPAGVSAPSDSAPLSDHYNWAWYNPVAWQGRTNAGASITVAITNTPGVSDALISGNQPVALAADSIAAVPYVGIDMRVMEKAISRIIGSTTGYRDRVRSWPSDIYLHGANYCYHTRESAPSDPNQVVPFLFYYRVYPAGNQFYPDGMTSSDSPNPQDACRMYYNYMSSTYGPPNYVGWNVTTGTSTQCNITDNQGHLSVTAQIIYNNNPGSSTLACSENAINSYSKNGVLLSDPFPVIGNAGTDSVTPMNARASLVSGWAGLNATILSRRQSAFWFPAVCAWRCSTEALP